MCIINTIQKACNVYQLRSWSHKSLTYVQSLPTCQEHPNFCWSLHLELQHQGYQGKHQAVVFQQNCVVPSYYTQQTRSDVTWSFQLHQYGSSQVIILKASRIFGLRMYDINQWFGFNRAVFVTALGSFQWVPQTMKTLNEFSIILIYYNSNTKLLTLVNCPPRLNGEGSALRLSISRASKNTTPIC